MNDARLYAFPQNSIQALAMLYLSQQDISNLSPSELLDKYKSVIEEMDNHMYEE